MPIIDLYQIFGLEKCSSISFLSRKVEIFGSENVLLKLARLIALLTFGRRFGTLPVIRSKPNSRPERTKLNTIEAFVAFLAR